MERIVNRLRACEQRLEWLFRKLEDALNRIRFAEQRVREVAGQPGLFNAAPAFDPGTVLAVGITTSTVGPATGTTTPGTGTATPYTLFAAGTLSAAGDAVNVWNTTDKTIASGAVVQLKFALGAWWVDVVDKCSNLS